MSGKIFPRDSDEGSLPENAEELIQPYRISASINTGGKTYRFSHIRGDGKAVYKLVKGEATQVQDTPVKPSREERRTQTAHPHFASQPTPEELASLPAGAILHNGFVGRYFHNPADGKRYSNPPEGVRQLSNGQYVLVPVD